MSKTGLQLTYYNKAYHVVIESDRLSCIGYGLVTIRHNCRSRYIHIYLIYTLDMTCLYTFIYILNKRNPYLLIIRQQASEWFIVINSIYILILNMTMKMKIVVKRILEIQWEDLLPQTFLSKNIKILSNHNKKNHLNLNFIIQLVKY